MAAEGGGGEPDTSGLISRVFVYEAVGVRTSYMGWLLAVGFCFVTRGESSEQQCLSGRGASSGAPGRLQVTCRRSGEQSALGRSRVRVSG